MIGNYEETLARQNTEARARRSVKHGNKSPVRPIDDNQRPVGDEFRYQSQDGTTWSGAATLSAFDAPSADFGLAPNSQMFGAL